MTNDPELALQLKQAPNARERARLLDIDYDAIVATNWRLRGATAAITVGYVVLATVAALYLGLGGASLPVADLLKGAIAAALIGLLPVIVGGVGIQILSSTSLPPLRQQLIADGLQVAAGPLALVGALAVLPELERLVFILFFPPLAALASLLGVQQLPLAIVLKDRNLQRVVQVMRTIPAELTLLGGKARLTVAYFSLLLAELLGISLLLATSPWWVVVIVPLRVGLALAALRAIWARGAAAGLIYSGVAAAVFLTAGLTAAAIA